MNRAAGDSHPRFTPRQGQYLAFIHALHAGEWASASASGHTTLLSADAAVGLPDAADARTRRADLTPRRGAAEYHRPSRSSSLARLGASAGSTGQNHCAEVL